MKKIILLLAISTAVFSCSGSDDSDSTGDSNNCPKPISLSVNNLTNTTATLNWSTNVITSLNQIEYGTLGFPLGTGITLTIPNQFVNIENLIPQTQYSFYSRVFCNESNTYSGWAGPFSFVTFEDNPYCNNPSSLGVQLYSDSVTYNHIDLSWSDGDFDGSQITYGPEGFLVENGTIQTIDDTIYPSNARISNLESNTSYDFYVRNICAESGYSAWIGPVTQSTLEEPLNINCIDPTSFTSVGSGTTGGNKYFDFTWNYDFSQNSWEIAAVPAGSPFSTSNVIATSFEPVRLTYGGMTSGQAYDFYIRANCGGTNGFSGWVGPVTVTAQ